ncbi:MAG: tRNA (adenosine(37)-N6)-threonylcarbamoyltransferase complex dimerization subunit type 1 TsaB [Ethanoligenens sp.]
MKILAIDTSSVTASAALCEDTHLLGEVYVHIPQTHSETLMPAVCELLRRCKTTFSEIALFAVSTGPGSFTGVRIGVAAVKGMALACGVPCVGVSALETAAWNIPFFTGTICAVMDARRGQVYNALFTSSPTGLVRRCMDRAVGLDTLLEDLPAEPVLLVGDGAELCYNAFKEHRYCLLAPDRLRFSHAGAVAALGLDAFQEKRSLTPDQLMPVYLRLPQAERELRAKMAQNNTIRGASS